jgi:hypothetical protein
MERINAEGIENTWRSITDVIVVNSYALTTTLFYQYNIPKMFPWTSIKEHIKNFQIGVSV